MPVVSHEGYHNGHQESRKPKDDTRQHKIDAGTRHVGRIGGGGKTDFAVGSGVLGCATTHQATARLNARAAQYGGRIRHARLRAKPPMLRSFHCDRAGAIANEKPDRTMNTTTAKWP